MLNSIGKKFNCEQKKLSDDSYLHIVNIKDIDSELAIHIDQCIVSICEGSTTTSLSIIKKRLKYYFSTKSDSTVMGSIAEFFCHLYLVEIGFKQEFLYLNLEEGSIKKGFDGYYSLLNEEWIFESKSGYSSTLGNSHKSKIVEAYNDLEGKVSGLAKNNPWQNAYNHACHVDVNCNGTIRQNIKKLSENYTENKYSRINDFNIMPGSTIFLENAWEDLEMSQVEIELTKLVDTFQFDKINIICINNMSIKLFIKYLDR